MSDFDNPVPVVPEPPFDPERGGEEVALDSALGSNPVQPEQRSRRVPRWVLIVASVVLVVSVGGSVIHLPYCSVGPGPAVNVLSRIKIIGAQTFPSKGRLLLTTASVSNSPLSVWDAARVWLDSDTITVPKTVCSSPGRTSAQREAEGFDDIERSKLTAELAAFRALGQAVPVLPGARVLTVIPQTPAAGKVKPQDLVVRIDGKQISTPQEMIDGIHARKIGDEIRLDVVRAGKSQTLSMRTGPSLGNPKVPGIGVTLAIAYRFPHDVEINTDLIGGPSGGLVFALSLADALSADDLTRGHIVAVTGTIAYDPAKKSSEPLVGPIGAIEEKVLGAKRAGADVFIVPQDDAAAAFKVAPKSMRIIAVRTLREAIVALRKLTPLKR